MRLFICDQMIKQHYNSRDAIYPKLPLSKAGTVSVCSYWVVVFFSFCRSTRQVLSRKRCCLTEGFNQGNRIEKTRHPGQNWFRALTLWLWFVLMKGYFHLL